MLSRVFPWNWRRSSEQYVRGVQHEAALARALISPVDLRAWRDAGLRRMEASAEMEIGVDEGIPGSDRSVLSVRTSDGHTHVDAVILQEGNDFVIRAGDGSILGRSDSKEDVMEILHFMLVPRSSDEQLEDEELLEVPEDEELLEELDEPLENASRFDIIDIE